MAWFTNFKKILRMFQVKSSSWKGIMQCFSNCGLWLPRGSWVLCRGVAGGTMDHSFKNCQIYIVFFLTCVYSVFNKNPSVNIQKTTIMRHYCVIMSHYIRTVRHYVYLLEQFNNVITCVQIHFLLNIKCES